MLQHCFFLATHQAHIVRYKSSLTYNLLTDLDFSLEYLFSSLYADPCKAAIALYTMHTEIQLKFISAVLHKFQVVFAKYADDARSASSVHHTTLIANHTHLADLKSHRSCFCCFSRMPKKVLPCSHALCDPCIRIFGHRSRSERNTYKLPECVLCGVNYRNSIFRFVPPTAGIRILSVDGGGVRGVIPLTFLQHLNSILAPFRCAAKDHFDLVCGTSAGKII